MPCMHNFQLKGVSSVRDLIPRFPGVHERVKKKTKKIQFRTKYLFESDKFETSN